MRPKWVAAVVMLCCGLFHQVHAVGGGVQSSAAFSAGREAYLAGRYPEALSHFQTARRHGLDSPALHYNLGVCYYRLQRYSQAAEQFAILARQPENASVGHYNLGLIALQLGRTEQARRQFRATLLASPPDEIRQLAERAIDHLPPPPAARRHQGLIAFSAGYDDNVTLESEADLIGVSERADAFGQLIAGVRSVLTGTRNHGVRLDAGAYLRAHQDLDAFDQQAGRLGVSLQRRVDDWLTLAGGNFDLIYLDGKRFESIATLTAQAEKPHGKHDRVLWQFRVAHIDAGDQFSQLTGWRHRLRAERRLPLGAGRIDMGYELEYNRRHNLDSGGQRISQSPLRNSLYAEYVWPPARHWELTLRGHARRSDYRDEDIRNIAGVIVRRARRDTQYGAAMRVAYRITRAVQVYGQAAHTDNHSNISTLEYQRNEAQLGMEMVF